MSTNVERKFFNTVNQCFKPEHPLRKIFNKNTLKLSYSCMPNLAQKVNAYNKSVLKRNQSTPKKPCNCRVKQKCPLNGNCQARNIIYQASVKTDRGVETYVGLTGDHFKSRFRNHTASFRDQRKKNTTELSKHIWELKNNNTEFTITWKILARASCYSNTTKRCNLCLTERFFIICRPELCTLNKRNELASTCRHATKILLKNS